MAVAERGLVELRQAQGLQQGVVSACFATECNNKLYMGGIVCVQTWSGGGVGLIKSVDEPAEEVVRRIVSEAAAQLRRAAAAVVG